MRAISGAKIALLNGRYFDFDNVGDCDSFRIHDIAHSLAMQCRFNGYTKEFYSVAEHSLNVMKLVSDENKFEALMHDATEAFVGDVVKPLKNTLIEYVETEKKVRSSICWRFGKLLEDSLPEEVHEADLIMLAYEKKYALNNYDEWKSIESVPADFEQYVHSHGVSIEFMSPKEAKFKFLEAFGEFS